MRRVGVGLVLLCVTLLSGCANLKAVRGFAEETRRISEAFDPMLGQAVEQCRLAFLHRRVYTTDAPLSGFDAEAAWQRATQSCRPIEDSNGTAQAMSRALADYASQLMALADDGSGGSGGTEAIGENHEALAGKLEQFQDAPRDQLGAIGNLLRFVSRGASARSKQEAIAEALGHEEAVGALADALVVHAERVHGAYLRQRLADQDVLADALRSETASPTSSRLWLMDLHAQTRLLKERQQSVARLRAAVAQMKVALHDLRTHLTTLSAQERWVEVRKLGREVRGLHRQRGQAF